MLQSVLDVCDLANPVTGIRRTFATYETQLQRQLLHLQSQVRRCLSRKEQTFTIPQPVGSLL